VMKDVIERIEKSELCLVIGTRSGLAVSPQKELREELLRLAKLGQQSEVADLRYWKAKAEGEHLAFVVVQEENDQLRQQLADQAKYAELGQLAMESDICYFGYSCHDGDCHGVECLVGNYYFCQKRAELLDKVECEPCVK